MTQQAAISGANRAAPVLDAAASPSIGAMFEAQARARPEAPALTDGRIHLSYGALNDRADRLAWVLTARGVVRRSFVALLLPRGIDAIIAMLAVLKAGAAFVALDTVFPASQLRLILRDCAPAFILAAPTLLEALPPDIARDYPSLTLGPGEEWPGTGAASPRASRPEAAAEDAAYVIFTSGSTGAPKGVLVPHRGVTRLVVACGDVALGPGRVLLAMAPLNFDACIFEIFGGLLTGACVAVLEGPPSLDAVAACVAAHGVTTLFLTSGLFHLFARHRLDALAGLHTLITGGDVLSPPLVARAYRALPGVRLLLAYGPTENTVFTTIHPVAESDLDGAPVPIGRPIGTDVVLVADEAGRALEDGATGQLWVSGRGVALGYLNRPDLTERAFVTRETGARFYKTGDLGWRDADGVLHFAGRADRQVKINGKRVELDAVERALRDCGGVEDAAAVLREDGDGRKRIVGYVTGAGWGKEGLAALRGALRHGLPDFMVPAEILALPVLPLTPSGKLDRARLPDAPPPLARPGEAPRGEIERMLADAWQRVLGRDQVGTGDNFFDLGGTSLQLIELHAVLEGCMPGRLSLVDLFQYPRISLLASRLAGEAASGAAAPSSRARLAAEASHRARQARARAVV